MLRISNEIELAARLQGINGWIFDNFMNVGNANMYEITQAMLARNNLRVLKGENTILNDEIQKMIRLRGGSILEFLSDVPECQPLFDAVKNGFTGETLEEMELICKSLSVPFFINNTRRRGFDGDITMPDEVQKEKAFKNFEHDNFGEITSMVESYNVASDEVKKVTYPAVNYVLKNSVPVIRDNLNVTPIENENKLGFGI